MCVCVCVVHLSLSFDLPGFIVTSKEQILRIARSLVDRAGGLEDIQRCIDITQGQGERMPKWQALWEQYNTLADAELVAGDCRILDCMIPDW